MKLPPGHVAGQGVVKPKCTGGFGERMLRTMGWEAGKGLGKEGQGMKEAIQVKKKEDTVGVSSCRRRRHSTLPSPRRLPAALRCRCTRRPCICVGIASPMLVVIPAGKLAARPCRMP